jgi:hypothetical protein
VDFSDCQRLEQLRRKVSRAGEVLSSNIRILQGCQARYRHLAPLYGISLDSTSLGALEVQEHELEGYKSAIEEILEYSEGIARLVNPFS